MEVILLERVAKLGQMGDVVRVKDGFARNFLLPQGKALRATEANRKRFEAQRVQLEARNLERKQEAEAVAEKLDGQSFIVVRQAGETGQLYGSVSTRDIADVDRRRRLHGQPQPGRAQPADQDDRPAHGRRSRCTRRSKSTITVNVARSDDEAERQAKGEDLTGRVELEREDGEERGRRGSPVADGARRRAGDGSSARRLSLSVPARIWRLTSGYRRGVADGPAPLIAPTGSCESGA